MCEGDMSSTNGRLPIPYIQDESCKPKERESRACGRSLHTFKESESMRSLPWIGFGISQHMLIKKS